LGEAGLIAKQDQDLFLFGLAQNLGPGLLCPGQPGRCVQMIRHEAALLEGETELIQQLRNVMWVVLDAKAVQNQVLDLITRHG